MIEALEGISDQELFDQANADEAPEDEPVAEAPAAEPEQPEQARDEQGRFAAKAAEEPAAPVVAAEPEKPAVDDDAPQVPSWRVREINEEKRAAQAERDALKAERDRLAQERDDFQRRLQATQKPPEPIKVERPDPLLDPEGYAKAMREEIRQEILSERREESLQRAHKTYKAEFEEAYEAARKQIDPGLAARMQNSRDPGETLIEWHREQKARAEVGTDPNAYFQRKLDEWLSDPANQAKVIEKARGAAEGQLQPGKAAPVNLPPSLTRATNASTITSADDNDVSDEGLWRHANA